MSNKSGIAADVISLPKGGGALSGIGEKFSPDLHTGTGQFTVPLALPPGRNGFHPDLKLTYSSGAGNGPFGLGWSISVPGISRKTQKGIPQYRNTTDTFILSGAEDLVRISNGPSGPTRYRPRTEGLFARIDHHHGVGTDFWEVRSRNGLVSVYGTRGAADSDPAVIADPADRDRIFAWKLSGTSDPFGNLIEYAYERDLAEDGPHSWDQLYLKQIRYADYADGAHTAFLMSVTFDYEDRQDAFSDYRAGFEIRCRRRCRRILVETHADHDRPVRAYALTYTHATHNLVSLLNQVEVVGYNDAGDAVHERPPLIFGYSAFEPERQERRNFFPLRGDDMPPASLGHPEYELADLSGNGLPDVLQMNGVVRRWRNLGGGRFDFPRFMHAAPAGLSLADPGVQLLDANGDGRIDLLVTSSGLSGYFPLRFDGTWDRDSFQRYEGAPSFTLKDPDVKLVDLDGDGITDVIRSGSRFECFFNDQHRGWSLERTQWVERRALDEFPNVNFSDPRVKWADMSGDGLQDIVLVYDGCIEYWPNLGYGRWGKRTRTRNSPRFPYGYDPRRILLGDVDGDGLADLIYVDDARVTLWINQSGNGWSVPIEIRGTPPVTDMDAVRLADMLGTGVGGILWSADAGELSRQTMFFLDLTGGLKPYLLIEMDNRMGAVTRVGYAPSTSSYLDDERRPETRWKTALPFPVQVVSRVEVIDAISGGKLTTDYLYHHGYWDGAEREFRGFGMVEQRDSETFDSYNRPGLHGGQIRFSTLEDRRLFSPPTRTKTWFHEGPVGEEFGDWQELDLSSEYWPGDPSRLNRHGTFSAFLSTVDTRRVMRDAVRALRGSVLRTELYALDGSDREDRPNTVTEYLYGVRDETRAAADGREGQPIFFAHRLAERTTQWERGHDPMTTFVFTDDYDAYGQPQSQIRIGVPRNRQYLESIAAGQTPPEPYLAMHTRTEYARRDEPDTYIVDRVARTTSHEIRNDGRDDVLALKAKIDRGMPAVSAPIISQSVSFFDGPAFQGLPFGQIGTYGALVRTDTLLLTDDVLQVAWGTDLPPYFRRGTAPAWTAEYVQEFRDRLPALAGYHYQAGSIGSEYSAGFFASSRRRKYDFHADAHGIGRGLVIARRDALGHDTAIEYDSPYALLPVTVTDAAGLRTRAEYDYRVMQARLIIDPNGNRTRFAFAPLGLLNETWMVGSDTRSEGDRQRPSVRLEYDFKAFAERGEPAFVRTIRHAHHDTETDVAVPERDETISTVEYSDGFGRLLQTRRQGEDVRFGDGVFGGGTAVLSPRQSDGAGSDVVGAVNASPGAPNVVVSGWQRYDNKGRVVEKYEPFFSEGWTYAPSTDVQKGQKATVFYDARGRPARTLNADGSEQRMVYGVPANLADPREFTPTPWEAYTYDENDNAGRTHAATTTFYRHHWDTPSSIVMDAFGRTVRAIQRHRAMPSGPGDPLPAIDEYRTTSSYDIQGRVLSATDPLNRVAFRYVYDLNGRLLRTDSIDAGARWSIADAAGNVVEQRDSKGALLLRAFDEMSRSVRLWARDGAGQPVTLRERLVYGDSAASGLTAAGAADANLMGKLYRQYDEAGLLTCTAYDFKGHIVEKTRRVIADSTLKTALDSASPHWEVSVFRVDWDTLGTADLAATEYQTTFAYDALNRIKTERCPQNVDGVRQELRPQYNRAGALERIAVDATSRVDRIAYNAKGQRTLITYANQVMTRYAYDPKTFRLVRLRTDRHTTPGPLTYRPTGAPIQDLAYEYDLSGNVVAFTDQTPGCGIRNNPDAVRFPQLTAELAAGDAIVRRFEYDPLYRLISATGRECRNISAPRSWTDEARCGFNSANHGTPDQGNAPNLTSGYRERYDYDPAGNLVALIHSNNAQSWTRHCGFGGMTPQQWKQEWPAHLDGAAPWTAPPGNHLTHVGDDRPGVSQTHVHDAAGNLIRENTDRHFEWDHSNRLRVYRTQASGAEPSVLAQYLYDTRGERVMKITRRQGGRYEVVVYIDGTFEHGWWTENGAAKEDNRLHVLDNERRVAVSRVGDRRPVDMGPGVEYHLADHLGSSAVVIDDTGGWINREEYFPYGETSLGSFARKRYRFTGKERDEESGLQYHGARYYASWLTRWVSPDPAGAVDGANLFVYVRGRPLNGVDPTGLAGEPADAGSAKVELPDASRQTTAPVHGADSSPKGQPKAASGGAVPDKGRAVAQTDAGAKTSPKPDAGSAPPAGNPASPKDSYLTAKHELRDVQKDLVELRKLYDGIREQMGREGKNFNSLPGAVTNLVPGSTLGCDKQTKLIGHRLQESPEFQKAGQFSEWKIVDMQVIMVDLPPNHQYNVLVSPTGGVLAFDTWGLGEFEYYATVEDYGARVEYRVFDGMENLNNSAAAQQQTQSKYRAEAQVMPNAAMPATQGERR